MENFAYTCVVFGSFADSKFESKGKIFSVLKSLHHLDLQITNLVSEEDKSGIDHTEEIEELLETAADEMEKISDFVPTEIFFNDEISEEIPGRLRIEIKNNQWGSEKPLYLN